MKTTALPLLLAILFLSLLMCSCQKEAGQSGLSSEEEQEASSVSTESEAEADIIFSDIFDQVIGVSNEVGMTGIGIFGQQAPDLNLESARPDSTRCHTVTRTRLNTTGIFPVKIEIDFGTTGCTGRDGRRRYGKIITVYTGRLIEAGQSATTTFEGYRVDSVSVAGTYKVTNTGTATQRQFTIELKDARLSHPNGDYIQRSSLRVYTQTEGQATPELAIDDAFRIEGKASGKVRRGSMIYSWQSEIIEPLVKKFSCRWIVRGIVKVKREGISATSTWISTLNYGPGTCDNKAVFIINGNERQITLH